MPAIEFRPVDRRDRRNLELVRPGPKDHSQHGETAVLRRIMQIVGESDRWIVEFGAWDGVYLSNSRDLIVEDDWRAVLIEAHPTRFKDLEELYAENDGVITLNRLVGFGGGDNTLDSILSETEIPENFDILVVDIDGNDWHVLESLTNFDPKIIMIEFNPTIPNDVYFVQDRDFGVNQGSSLLAIIELAKSKNYELIGTVGGNGIFCKSKYYGKFFIEDNSIDAMCFSNNQGRLFITYDGTLYNTGLSKLFWTGGRFSLNPDSLQIVPEEYRRGANQAISRIIAQAREAEDKRATLEILARGLEVHPDHPRLLSIYSSVAKILERWDIAAESLRTILKQKPNDDATLHGLSMLEGGKLGNTDAALQHAERAFALNPAPEVYALNLAKLLLAREETGRAIRVLRESAQVNTASFRILRQLVPLLGRTGEQDEVLNLMRRFKESGVDHDPETIEKCRKMLVGIGLGHKVNDVFPKRASEIVIVDVNEPSDEK